MLSNERSIDPNLLERTKEILTNHFKGPVNVKSAVYLSNPERRNVIIRLELESELYSCPKSVILKQSLPQGIDKDDQGAFARFARDWAGLQFINSVTELHNTPRFYGSDNKLRFILIEDLGNQHISLVDSLTGNDREEAVRALKCYMKALGSFHASSFNFTEDYQELLKKVNPEADTPLKEFLTKGQKLKDHLKELSHALSLPLSEAFFKEVDEVLISTLLKGPFTVLLHGDIAPDNVFYHDKKNKLELIDFEWCGLGSALLDASFLRMCIPTGWCSKTLPETLLEELEDIYKSELSKTIPAACDNQTFNTAFVLACALHTLHQMTVIPKCILKDEVWGSGPLPKDSLWKPEENLLRPRVITRLGTLVSLAEKHQMLPAIKEVAENLLSQLKTLWPGVGELDTYPAFKEYPSADLMIPPSVFPRTP